MSETRQPAPPKPRLPNEDMAELQQAWVDSDDPTKVPAEKREAFRQALREVHAELMAEMDPPADNTMLIDKLGKLGLETMDYGFGNLRTAGMSAAALLAGRPELIQAQDFKDAANPFDGRVAPSAGEWLNRAGVPEGGSLSDIPGADGSVFTASGEGWPLQKHGPLDITARGALGFTADAGLSTKGVQAVWEGGKKAFGKGTVKTASKRTAPQINAAIQASKEAELAMTPLQRAMKAIGKYAIDPAGQALSEGGEAVYRSVFKQADDMAVKAGQPRVSSVMLRNNAVGTTKQLEQQAEAIRRKLGKEVSAMSDEVHAAAPETLVGQRYDVRAPVTEHLNELRNKPGMQEAADKASAKISKHFNDAYGNKTEFSLPELDDIKKLYQERTRTLKGYEGQAASNSVNPERVLGAKVEAEASRRTAQRARRASEDLLDEYQPGMGGQMFLKNRDQASLIAGAPGLKKEASKGFDTILRDSAPSLAISAATAIPTAIMGNPKLAAALAAMGILSNSAAVRTGAGLLAAKQGKNIANLTRAKLIEDHAEGARKRSPWHLLTEEMFKDAKK